MSILNIANNIRASSLHAPNFHVIFKAWFSSTVILKNKALKNQAKVLQKILGHRKSGSRKWYINADEGPCSLKFDSSKGIKKDNSKHSVRRISVLNKLFMMHVTDLMTAGLVAERIEGKGVQITRVKMSSDFTHLHILWTSKDDSLELTNILNKSAGILRHELCQLRVMGEVPNIKFIKDRTDENLAKISELLKNIDIPEENNLDNQILEKTEKLENLSFAHDVFGLKRQEIMNNIRVKSKKSIDAWEIHKKN